jgi:hypothetical protein
VDEPVVKQNCRYNNAERTSGDNRRNYWEFCLVLLLKFRRGIDAKGVLPMFRNVVNRFVSIRIERNSSLSRVEGSIVRVEGAVVECLSIQ